MKKLIVLLALLPIVAFGRGGLVTPTISANGGSGGGSATNISLDASGVVSAPAGQNLVTKFTSNGTNAMVAAAQGVVTGNTSLVSFTVNGSLDSTNFALLSTLGQSRQLVNWVGNNSFGAYGVSFNVTNLTNDLVTLSNKNFANNLPVYVYTIDDGWAGGTNSAGMLYANSNNFPQGMAAAAALIHAYGMKACLYIEPNSTSSGGKPQAGALYQTNIAQAMQWGFDGIKFEPQLGVPTAQANLQQIWNAWNAMVLAYTNSGQPIMETGASYLSHLIYQNPQLASELPAGITVRFATQDGDQITNFNDFMPFVLNACSLDWVKNAGIANINFAGVWSFGAWSTNFVNENLGMQAILGGPIIYFASFGTTEPQLPTNNYLYQIDLDSGLGGQIVQSNSTAVTIAKFMRNGQTAIQVIPWATNSTATVTIPLAILRIAPNNIANVLDIWSQTNYFTSTNVTFTCPANGGATLLVSPQSPVVNGGNVIATNNQSIISAARFQNGINDGLILWYPFSESSGTYVNDFSTGGSDGLLTDATLRTNVGVYGYGLQLNGTGFVTNFNSSVNVALQNLTNFTAAVWINIKSDAGNNSFLGIIGRGDGTVNGDWNVVLQSSNYLYFDSLNNSHSDSRPAYNPSTRIATNVWHLVGASYDGVSNRLWLDGQQVASAAQSGFLPYEGSGSANAVIYFGTRYGATAFTGNFDDAKIWNRALQSNEFVKIYNDGVASLTPALNGANITNVNASTSLSSTNQSGGLFIPATQAGKTNVTLVGATAQTISFPVVMPTTNYVVNLTDNGGLIPGLSITTYTTTNFVTSMTALTFTGNMTWSIIQMSTGAGGP
jgi:hypothetical protein